MDRKEFLSMLGLSAGGVILESCIGGCKKSSTTAPSVNFTLDLTQSANAALTAPGGYLYSNNVVVAQTMSGSFIAVSESCTHEGATVQYVSSRNSFQCPRHGAKFSNTGSVTQGPATSNLKQYTVTKNGNILTIAG